LPHLPLLSPSSLSPHHTSPPLSPAGSSALGSASSIQAAVRQLEAEADAIIQMSESNQAEAATRREESPMDVDEPLPANPETQSLGTCVRAAISVCVIV
uniref:Uncharacterized protein n=1 Tax=Callorhinchus milii TaxID=7868 RepID=A0A4W3GMF3_CALMI